MAYVDPLARLASVNSSAGDGKNFNEDWLSAFKGLTGSQLFNIDASSFGGAPTMATENGLSLGDQIRSERQVAALTAAGLKGWTGWGGSATGFLDIGGQKFQAGWAKTLNGGAGGFVLDQVNDAGVAGRTLRLTTDATGKVVGNEIYYRPMWDKNDTLGTLAVLAAAAAGTAAGPAASPTATTGAAEAGAAAGAAEAGAAAGGAGAAAPAASGGTLATGTQAATAAQTAGVAGGGSVGGLGTGAGAQLGGSLSAGAGGTGIAGGGVGLAGSSVGGGVGLTAGGTGTTAGLLGSGSLGASTVANPTLWEQAASLLGQYGGSARTLAGAASSIYGAMQQQDKVNAMQAQADNIAETLANLAPPTAPAAATPTGAQTAATTQGASIAQILAQRNNGLAADATRLTGPLGIDSRLVNTRSNILLGI